MGGMKISDLDFVRLLPAFMRDDEAAIALSNAVDILIGEPGKRLHTLRTWDKIDELSEAECDELAWELDIDWYDSTGMGLEEKRETVKMAQQIKRKRGTKWAVESLITAYLREGYVMEWYEMDGYAPYTFIVLTTNTHIGAENYVKFVKSANAAKNERSHIAGIFYLWEQGPDPGIECALGSSLHRYDFTSCGTQCHMVHMKGAVVGSAVVGTAKTAEIVKREYYPQVATVGFIAKQSIETEPDITANRYGYKKTGETVCGTYPQQLTIGAAKRAAAATEPTTTHALYAFPECGENGYKATHGAAIVGTAVAGRAIVTS